MAKNWITGKEIPDFKPYKEKRMSGIVALGFFISIICLSAPVILFVLSEYTFEPIQTWVKGLSDWKEPLVGIGLTILLISFAGHWYSKIRVPQARWRVREELKLALYDKGFLPDNVLLWKNYLSISPFIKKQRQPMSNIAHFRIRNVKVSDEKIKEVEQSFAFSMAQDVEIAPYINKHNRRDGFKLTIFYDSDENIFNALLKAVKHE